MSQFPSLPLFGDVFISDTSHLSAAETGAYICLLIRAWSMETCSLPDDDVKLARWARVDARTWRKMRETVMAFWTLADGQWTQKRLTKEREMCSKRAEVARQNGKHGGRGKSNKINAAQNPAGSSWAAQTKAPSPIASAKAEAAGAPAHTRDPGRVFSEAIFQASPEMQAAAARSPGLLSMAPVYRWLQAGADLEQDIIPAVRDYLARPKHTTPRTWDFFETIIAEHRQKRLSSPLAAIVAPPPPESRLQPNGALRPDRTGQVHVIHRVGANWSEPLRPDSDRMAEHWPSYVARWRRTQAWNREDLGPAPGEAHCVCPDQFLTADPVERVAPKPLNLHTLPEFGMAR